MEDGMYTKRDIDEARQKMLDHLASIAGGQVILGCCTQSCCTQEAQEFAVSLSAPNVKSMSGQKA
jgi:hypothetical protein